MPQPITVPMSPGVTVSENYIVRFTALDPDTGAVVSGVSVSQSAILGNEIGGSGDVVTPPPTDLQNTAILLPGPA